MTNKAKKAETLLPTQKNTIKRLWLSILTLSEIAIDLEESIPNKTSTLSPRQKNLLKMISKVNDECEDQYYYFEFVRTQQQWLEFLTILIQAYKRKEISEQEALEELAKECTYYFQTDEKDYESIALKYVNDNFSKYFVELFEKKISNEERRTVDPKHTAYVSPEFHKHPIEKFAKNAWKARRGSKEGAQGEKSEAKNVLNKILINSSATKTRDILKSNYTSLVPIYFHNEDFLHKNQIFIKIAKELNINLPYAFKQQLEGEIKLTTYFTRVDTPASKKIELHISNKSKIQTPEGWS